MAVGSTPRDSGNIPLGCVLVPGDTTPQALQGGAEFTDANSNISAPVRAEITPNSKATYVASGTVVPVTGATDLVTIIGSATKLVKLLRVIFSGTITTAAINGSVSIVKRSTADTAGTSTAPTIIPLDRDRKSTRLNSSHTVISYAVFCLKKKKKNNKNKNNVNAKIQKKPNHTL